MEASWTLQELKKVAQVVQEASLKNKIWFW